MAINYKIIKDELTQNETVIRTDDDGKIWSIPSDPANSDYQTYLAWKAKQGRGSN